MNKRRIDIHRSRSTRSFFHRSLLLVSDKMVQKFDHYLTHYPIQSVRHSQVDSPAWQSKIMLPEQIIEGIHSNYHDYIGNREPLLEFAYGMYLQFIKDQQLSLPIEISNSLFSGQYKNYCYRITRNAFPYHTHASIQHLVAWINPNYQFSEEKIMAIKREIQHYNTHKGYPCFLFENTGHHLSIPDVRHIQIFLYV